MGNKQTTLRMAMISFGYMIGCNIKYMDSVGAACHRKKDR